MKVTWEIATAFVSPLRGNNGTVYWETTDHYHYAEKAALTLEPPSNVVVSDVPDDNGHRTRLTWTLSPSEKDGVVDWYRVYRSRSETLTAPESISEFSSWEELIAGELRTTVLIDSVTAGTAEYEDCVPVNGVRYYYWLQAVGSTKKLSLTGTVVDQDGNPVSGVLLRLYDAHGTVDMYAVSEWDGSYAFYDVPPGEYYLVAKRDDYALFSTMVTVK